MRALATLPRMLSLAVVTGVGWLIAGPTLMAWAYSMIGGQILAAQPAPTANQLYQAIFHLQDAQRWAPDDPAIYRQLAQANTALGNYRAAVHNLEQVYRLSPDSQTIRRDLAVAYTLAGANRQADALWAAIGQPPDAMASTGDWQLRYGSYGSAVEWYRLAALRDPEIAPGLLPRRVIAAALAGDPAADVIEAGRAAQLIGVVGPDGLRLSGGSLRWMTEIPQYQVVMGTPLSYPNGGETGIFWWTGEAIAVIEVQSAGEYQIAVGLCQCTPPPIEMRLGLDGRPQSAIVLSRADRTIDTFGLTAYLEPGLHTVHLWFDNNAVVDGVDRDARVSWLTVRPTAVEP